MQTITTIGLDIAKSVFQVHAVDAAVQVVIRRRLKRSYVLAFFQKLPSCLIGIEACASSVARAPGTRSHVQLMPPAYVATAFSDPAFDRDLIRGGIRASGQVNRTERPEHMAAPTNLLA